MITNLEVIDRLTTRARRDGTNLYLEVLDGPTVLYSELYTGATSVTATEVELLLSNILANYVRSGAGRPVLATYDASGNPTILKSDGTDASIGGGGVSRNSQTKSFRVLPVEGTRYTANSTFATLMTVKDGFRGFRLAFRNPSTSQTLTVKAKAVSLPALNTDAKSLTPVDVTFNGANTVVIPVATTTSEGQDVHSIAVSDFIPLEAVARTDVVGADPIIYIRATAVEGLFYAPVNWTAFANYNALNMVLRGAVNGNDAVTNWATYTMTTSDNGFHGIGHIELWGSGAKAARISVFADSLAAGVDTSINYPIKVAPLLAAKGIDAFVACHATGGQKRLTTSGQIRSFVPVLKPDFVVMHDYTVNSNALPNDQQLQSFVGDVEAVAATGALPIIVNMHGQATYARRVQKIFSGRYPIVDMNQLLNNGTYGTIADQYCRDPVTDRTHINDAGAAVIANAVADIVSSRI